MPSRLSTLAALAAAFLAASCSSSSPTTPTPPSTTMVVTSISPAIGSALGGTAVTITGSGFAAGATVTIGGAAATNVIVQSSAAITALAPPRAAGAADVVVTYAGTTASLPAAFTYVAPSTGSNAPPTVGAIATLGSRPNQPAGMADLGESLTLSVNVTDAETAPSALSYAWSATAGTFSGDGRSLMWTAPATLSTTPQTITVTLTVVEPYVEVVNGQSVSREHRITRSRDVRVHNSAEEVRAMARQFLLDFSVSSVPVDTVMQNFSSTCGGAQSERADVEKNRCNYTITDYTVGDGTPTVSFGGTCVLDNRVRNADACVVIPVRWVSTTNPGAMSCPVWEGLAPGTTTVADGLDQVTAVYEGGRWRLCHSDFVSPNPSAHKFKK